ncbi:ABC transporter substrate-binding protein [Alistipes sp.]|uniref:ABC transporter substrate-binding protein n=1 Tax=Alistipes sp. TaxID=1872444 RepID=UPI003AEFE182
MMVIVPRIALVSYLDTIPFLYGVGHGTDFRAELSTSDFSTSVLDFQQRRADLALVPVHVVPSLADARIVTGYCLGASGRGPLDRLLAEEPSSPLAALFAGPDAPLAGLPTPRKPFAYAVWVAHADTDPDWSEGLQHALTYGLEHTYEAVVEYGYDRRPYDAYGHLSQLDYIFDNQKRKALEKFWDSGLKVAPRANPG